MVRRAAPRGVPQAGSAPRRQPGGAADGDHFPADHVVRLPTGPLAGFSGKDAGVGRGAGKILVAAIGREAQLDVGMASVEVGQARHQPGAGQGRHAGQGQPQAAVIGAQFGAERLDGLKRRLAAFIELAAGLGQGQAVGVAAHQRLAEMRFEPRDGAADGALGHAQGLGRQGETAQPRGRHEGVQLGHGRRVQAHGAAVPGARRQAP